MRRRHVRHVHARRNEWVTVHRGGRPARAGGGCMVVILGMLALAGAVWAAGRRLPETAMVIPAMLLRRPTHHQQPLE